MNTYVLIGTLVAILIVWLLQNKMRRRPPQSGDGQYFNNNGRDSITLPPDVVDALSKGKKMEAIKRYRELTKCSLAEAKDAIDFYDSTHR